MQRWTAFLFAGLFALAVAVIVSKGGRRPAAPPKGAADAGVDAPHELVLADAGAPEPAADVDADVPADPSGLPSPDAGGTLLLSGEAPPALAGEAPKSVV